ncbi:MAG: LD-carboxypeptidase [Gammaproteobacteria bacterium]|nr:LD-carboxypeptidase [Gammaproteobacteria bacterium]
MRFSRRNFFAYTAYLGISGYAPSLQAQTRLILKPKHLASGMTVGLVSPASNAAEDESILASMEFVRSLGFKVKAAPNLFARAQYLAGSDDQRAADLNSFFTDPEVDAIFCTRGGYGTPRILPLLDYDAVGQNPKIFMGYSDITALLNAIHVKTGLVTFHGPMAFENFTDYTYREYQKVIGAPSDSVEIGSPPEFEIKPGQIDRDNRLTTINPGVAEGRLIGGNLSLLVTLLGTEFEPNFEGSILFLEDVSEPAYSIDRMLTHLWLAGKLEQVNGIVFGKFTDTDYTRNTFSVEEVIRLRCQGLGVPVLRGLMIGHTSDQTIVPIGIRAELDADVGTLTLLESPVT